MSAPKKYPATKPPVGEVHCAEVTSWFTRFVISTITTPLASISDSRPNAVVSISYSRVSKTARRVSRSVCDRLGWGAALSW